MTDNTSVCRFCLSEAAELFELFKCKENLVEKIEGLTSIKILATDELPKKSCLKCIENINQAYKIRQDIINAHRCLKLRIKKRLEIKTSDVHQSEEKKVATKIDLTNGIVEVLNPQEMADISSNSPFETVYLPRNDGGQAPIDVDEMIKKQEVNIKKMNVVPFQLTMKNDKQKVIQQKLQQQRLQQHHYRLMQQQRLHQVRIQLQQQLLQKLPLSQQKRTVEQHKLHQLQRQKLALQQKQKVVVNALKQSIQGLSNQLKNLPPAPGLLRPEPQSVPKTCTECGEVSEDAYAHKLHMKKHQSKTCEICHVTIRSDNFKKHMDNVHKDDPAVCEVCGKIAKNKESLRGHMYYIHLNRNIHKCEHCNKEFQSKHGYLHHLKKTHLGIRNQQCDICGKKFYSNYDVKKHINMTHKGSRPYICTYCNKGFSSTNARKVHMRQHTLETPYKCEECGGGFRQKVSLKTHMKSKHNLDLKDVEATQQQLSNYSPEEVKIENESLCKQEFASNAK